MADTMIFPSLTEAELLLPVYLCGAGHWDHQNALHRPEGYPHYQWLQVIRGEGKLRVGGLTYTVKAGEGLFLLPDEEHEYKAVKEPWELSYVAFDGREAAALAQMAGLSRSGPYEVSNTDIILAHMNSLVSAAQSERGFAGLECSKLVYALLLDLAKSITLSRHAVSRHMTRLQPVIDYIKQHYAEQIALSDLAEVAAVTPQHLCLLFKKAYQLRPMEAVNRERVSRSKEAMFQERGLLMKEIALLVGYDNPSYFSAQFKRYEGMSPEQFKQLHGLG
ncbi:AraC family transcriptional regulator [Paenibacillus sp. GCM10023252]|uniref:AraC family transcriptional regulator n=1 Tax=Paenibacillus sp. GCM10023252 TaxID=3252649 RepID=UPI0036174790